MLKACKVSKSVFACFSLIIAGILTNLFWSIPVPWGSQEFVIIAESRWVTVVTIVVVATAQALATVVFHTVTENRILTPSILGFDALYVLIQTVLIATWGVSAAKFDGVPLIVMQCLLMIGATSSITVWLLVKVRAHLHVLLLLGAACGIGFSSLSNFLQRILSPSEFDMLTARLFGNIAQADARFMPYAGVGVMLCGCYIWVKRNTLDVLAVGRDTAETLGVAVTRELVAAIVVVSVLVAISVSLVGPLTFYGFLVATLAYQWVPNGRHAHVLPLAVIIGVVALLGANFIMRYLWGAGGFVTVIIEIVGGILFLIVLLKRGVS